MTQLEAARKGIVTDQMAYAAEQEGLAPEFVREQVALGRMVILASHRSLSHFTAIGKGMRVKVNTNVGTSCDYVNPEEVGKVKRALPGH